MATETVRAIQSDAIAERVMQAAASVLEEGRALTFRELSRASGVPERTLYRYYPTRRDLLIGLRNWGNGQLDFDGTWPTDVPAAVALVRHAFPLFDRFAPVARELLLDPEGSAVLAVDSVQRRRAAQTLVRSEAPGLERADARRVAAAVQVLTAANAWHTLHEYWNMSGTEAAEVVALAVELLLAGARAKAERS
jgi:AcrR family transcriptional regulator